MDKTLKKSADQFRRWKNPRIKAVKKFVEAVGDKPLAQIPADDMLDFRSGWVERLETVNLTANPANKDLTHLGEILKMVNKLKRLGLHPPLSDLAIESHDAVQRPAFSVDWIRTELLAPGVLNGMNKAARAIVLTIINTGARPSEIARLSARFIKLDDNMPCISIEPDQRGLKTRDSRRKLALAGCSLDAILMFPAGFLRYTRPRVPSVPDGKRRQPRCRRSDARKDRGLASDHNPPANQP